jgi:hypothetical protein
MMTIRGRSEAVVVNEKERLKLFRRLDRAYACYAYVGLFAIAMLAVVALPATDAAREGYGMGLILPATLLPFALVAAIVMTARLPHHRTLVVLGLSTLLLALFVFAVGVSSSGDSSEYAMDIALGIYGAGAVLVPVWWFATGRRHHRELLRSNDSITH